MFVALIKPLWHNVIKGTYGIGSNGGDLWSVVSLMSKKAISFSNFKNSLLKEGSKFIFGRTSSKLINLYVFYSLIYILSLGLEEFLILFVQGHTPAQP